MAFPAFINLLFFLVESGNYNPVLPFVLSNSMFDLYDQGKTNMKRSIFSITAVAFAAILSCPAQAAEDMTHKTHNECLTMVKTGNVDVDFIRNMIPHHEMALGMAEKQLKSGKDAEARTMAQKIIDAQKKEIADMKDWLKSHQ